MSPPGRIQPRLDHPWLIWELGAPHQVLSWAVHRPGTVLADRLVWREVRDRDLPPGTEVLPWLQAELARIGATDAVTLLTARTLARHVTHSVTVEGITADCLVTAGLSNAERIGTRLPAPGDGQPHRFGTINIGLRLSRPLEFPAMLEGISIITQARTAAVIEAGLALPGGLATGTGTDCIALAAPAAPDIPPLRHVGLHTAAGEAIGRATHAAVTRAVRDWLDELGALVFPG